MSARVLHVCTTADFVRFMQPVLSLLSTQGYEVHVACSPHSELARICETAGAMAHPVFVGRAISPARDAQSLLHLGALMRRLRPDVVHAHTPKGGLLGMAAATLLGVPHRIYQMHGLRYETAQGRLRWLLESAERTSCALSHRVVCISRSVERRAVQDGVVSPDKAVVLGDGSAAGIDVRLASEQLREAGVALRQQRGIGPDDPVIGFAGRFARDKGLADLNAAWTMVSAAEPRAHLFLAGDVDPTDPIELESLLLQRHVHHLGRLRELRSFYAACDVFTLPSYREGLPQVLLEAAAMRVPVVATHVTGIVDVIKHEQTGLLVSPHDADALARALLRLLRDSTLRQHLARHLHHDVEARFAQQRVLAAYRAFYKVLLT